jgi:23S rRNA pseudouridine955/2504/2580 synthase
MKELTIGPNDAGQRLDRFLMKAVPLLPSSLCQKYLRLKRVRLNGRPATKGDTRLTAGDVLSLYLSI